MNKKIRVIVVSCVTLNLALIGFEAVAADAARTMQKQREQVQADRKAVIGKAMQLSSTQTEQFWALYDKYSAERKKNNDFWQKIVLEYAKHYPQVPDDVANRIMDDWLKIENQDVKLKKKYVRKFKSILTPQQLVRYFQTENKLDALFNSRVAEQIPLMEAN